MLAFSLLGDSNVTGGISTKVDGNIDLRFGRPKDVGRSRARFFKSLETDSGKIVEAQQVHKTNVVRVGKRQGGNIIPDADGMITNDHEVVLMLRVADCIPIFLFDPENTAIGLVHSGWKGTMGKIVLVAIQRMMLEFKTNPARLLVALGPSIGKCCNIWKDPPLQLQLPEWSPFIRQTANQYALDLPGFVNETARNAGVKQANIEVSSACTVMDQSLFSFKRSKETTEPEGRFAAVIGLLA
ncbi:MAG: hypothetical protein A2900_03700 [Candidatus Chisholmbacteria bacterium RIFCSPLOWO2_01_FULL_50_28]|uniref:Purine nucleoside phosphorylase n=1 Tax=Candidatus Chisholmbacteria bacterium RIFCSPHIGHO2_01_FULL_52_32 TaxID=1797591 RepID=A0A1G1VSS7_9BACT|nr:MAG: hypothetical protein A2786_03040 [Candidatus Chisholmbacteria bacterium RIFCSPHIGHO2_01_FULL_52_32]OGY20179.1 MAG: hypothetical protein A2900_03700 [Candidatus Chisholmbacteria bacterium RIFCSPLOWO2_01_FULL_50_28]